MSDLFFRIFKHLLPNARAWRLVKDNIRDFFSGLTGIGADIKTYLDNVWLDIFPETTRCLGLYEDQFALPNSGLTIQQRRDRLDATWKASGGQDPRYIQDTLQNAGFDVYVHEWWEPIPGRPGGGSINNDVTPVARNPFSYLWDGVTDRQFIGCGHDDAYCGGDTMFSNSQNSPPGYPLVNKVIVPNALTIGCGQTELFCGGDSASAGAEITIFSLKQYIIPADPTKYPFFLYIGGQNFPDQATVQLGRRDEFEDLCLKICPTEQWLGILVNYT
jgi:hypothetical protein